MTKERDLNRQAAALISDARSQEEKAKAAGVSATSLNSMQFAIALERIVAFVNAGGKPTGLYRFSATEVSALTAHLAELTPLV
jgi:hypothetical protein